MVISTINGLDLEKMFENGLSNLKSKEKLLNSTNVFPVADGDTGTNVRITFEKGFMYATSNININSYLNSFCNGALLGARGNSGTILSQFFKGFYTAVANCRVLGPGELRKALIYGYREAYLAVMNPVEGTILTVMREGIEHIKRQIRRSTTIEQLLIMYVSEMKKSLVSTPNMLPILKYSNVLDSGAEAFVTIFEGMLNYFQSEKESVFVSYNITQSPENIDETDYSVFNQNSEFNEGYCMEFILQLLKNENYEQNFDIEAYKNDLKQFGNSIVAVYVDTRIKIHIHTKTPSDVISISQNYGEFVTFKLENMQIQADSKIKKQVVEKEIVIITFSKGDGFTKIFEALGSEKVVEYDIQNKPSADEIVQIFNGIKSKKIIVLPNDTEINKTCSISKSMYDNSDAIEIIPTCDSIEGYYALSMDVSDSNDYLYRINQMKLGYEGITEVSLKINDSNFVFSDNKNSFTVSRDSLSESVIDGFKEIDGIEGMESCIIFKGENVSDEIEQLMVETLSENYNYLEIEAVYGGQSDLDFIIGII